MFNLKTTIFIQNIKYENKLYVHNISMTYNPICMVELPIRKL